MYKKHENNLYLIEVTTEYTDHWKGQADGALKLSKLGARKVRWYSGTNMNTHTYYARCDDDCLCLIKLAGYIVKVNVTEQKIESVRDKIKLSLSTLGFSKIEMDEVDVKKILHSIIDEHEVFEN